MMRNMKGKIFWLVRATRRVVEYRLEGERAGVVVDLLGLAPAQTKRADKKAKIRFFIQAPPVRLLTYSIS